MKDVINSRSLRVDTVTQNLLLASAKKERKNERMNLAPF